MPFPTIKSIDTSTRPRIQQQNVKPLAIKPAGFAQINLANTQATINGPYNIANGGNLTFKSFIQNTKNDRFRLGGVPYNIVFLEDSLTVPDDIIGDTVTGYNINGPFSMPQFTPHATSIDGTITLGGNDGDNLVYLTELINNTGSGHDIYVVTDTRVLTPIGGSA